MKQLTKQETLAILRSYPRGTRFLCLLLYVYFPYIFGIRVLSYGTRLLTVLLRGTFTCSLPWLAAFLFQCVMWFLTAQACLNGRQLRPGARWWLQYILCYAILSGAASSLAQMWRTPNFPPELIATFLITAALFCGTGLLCTLFYFQRRKDLFRSYTAEEAAHAAHIDFAPGRNLRDLRGIVAPYMTGAPRPLAPLAPPPVREFRQYQTLPYCARRKARR